MWGSIVFAGYNRDGIVDQPFQHGWPMPMPDNLVSSSWSLLSAFAGSGSGRRGTRRLATSQMRPWVCDQVRQAVGN